ncbi:MAG TPA: ATP-dependent Clp protease ATP-binding subunit [Candidatus Saccharimonadales bacterium]|nr:ATP-dependent Clp protease ATP-binding subunit [Candidatus Saccharimonadales bacterium]
MNPDITFQSLRAQKARMGHLLLSPAMQMVRTTMLLLAIIGAAYSWWAGMPAGLLLLCVAGPAFMLGAWAKNDLKANAPALQPRSVDDVLATSILGILPKNYTVKDLVDAAFKTPEGTFFVIRFGLSHDLFAAIAEHDHTDAKAVWQAAESIRQNLQLKEISAITVLVAIVETVPNPDAMLAQFQLGRDDLLKGVAWYHHLQDVIAQHKERVKDGGIGRDWSFGYTPMLSRFGLNISERITSSGLLMRDVAAHQAIVDRMMNLFTQGGRQNAALIGPLGSGKTTLVHALAQRLMLGGPTVPRGLKFQQVFALDPSSLIAQAHGRGELEGLVQQLFFEAYNAKNIILFLDDAHLFFEEGTGSVDLSNVLLPVLEAGGLRMILAMDDQHWQRISQRNAALAQYMNRVMVAPANEDDTLLIIEDQLIMIEHQQKANYTYQALREAYRLSDRYMQDQSMPGKALQLLESAGGFADHGLVDASSVRQAIEQSIGVKVGTADTTEERQTLLNLEDLIHQRMINQTRAVQVVSDALRRARAGVRNQQRPIGTFLFLGPTGVGKTELSKALAAVYFGGEDHLVRLDLNEYVQPGDVNRLIADAASDPHSLTAQIARQPFSVVLLDEIEKAHPNVLNTLLQLLDEGILRDINNREVSFRDAIIIATSNAGADRIRQYVEAGWQMEDFEQKFTDELITSNQFRPEFLNRFDEIVLFRPLNQEELLQVIDLILAGINKTLAVQKISVAVDMDAKRLLVQTGYDPRMGARPMRRIVQRAVENIVARRMLGGQVMPGEQISITAADVQTILSQEARPMAGGPTSPASPAAASGQAAGSAQPFVQQTDNSVSVDFHHQD